MGTMQPNECKRPQPRFANHTLVEELNYHKRHETARAMGRLVNRVDRS